MTELKGNVQGTNHKDLTDRARTEAAAYYGTECVNITLSHERAEAEYVHNNMFEPPVPAGTTFTADYTATIEHKWNAARVGISKCINCGTTNHNR